MWNLGFILLFSLAATAGFGQAHPDFSGIWTSATATPLQRPEKLKDKAFYTPAEAAEFERTAAKQAAQNSKAAGSVGTYNKEFFEAGTKLGKTLRTSIVIDPPDGRFPALTPAAEALKKRRMERLRNAESPEDYGLQDRCLAFLTAGPPMLPYRYNSNYRIIQTPDRVLVNSEMIHDARSIAMDGRRHAPADVKFWLGDSVGRWEGSTLVVDTTNFRDTAGFYGDAGGFFWWDENLHVVERFRFLDADTLLYGFEVEDPTAFTRSWKGELTLERSAGPIYEYACHEGNYALGNIMRFEAEKARQGAGKGK